nr:unnamed protein product [Callosobruchus analis]
MFAINTANTVGKSPLLLKSRFRLFPYCFCGEWQIYWL